MERAYKLRIYPTPAQEALIQRTFGCTRFVFNYFLARRKTAYEEEQLTIGYGKCCNELTVLKEQLEWLREVDATALQSSLQDLDKAYCGFFRRVKKGETPGYPRFKSKRFARKSFRSKRVGENIVFDGRRVKLPKLGWILAKGYTAVSGRILNATISQAPSGKYFVSLCCTGVEITAKPHTGAVVGLDMGIKSLTVTSDGQEHPNHKYLGKSLKKLVRLQRKLSRKPKESKRREKARVQVARLHETIANQRVDALHKLTAELIADYDIICVEKLKVRNMMRNRKLSRSIADVSWGELVRQLQYKAAWHGRQLAEISTFFPSSQLCSSCGHQNEAARNLAVREWLCPKCGDSHDRDVNAARNILREGLRLIS